MTDNDPYAQMTDNEFLEFILAAATRMLRETGDAVRVARFIELVVQYTVPGGTKYE